MKSRETYQLELYIKSNKYGHRFCPRDLFLLSVVIFFFFTKKLKFATSVKPKHKKKDRFKTSEVKNTLLIGAFVFSN